jgi:hypothetical protein
VLLAAKEAGPEGFAAALLGGHQLALFNYLMEIEHFDEFPADHYLELSKAIAENIRAQRDVIEMQHRARQPAGPDPAEPASPRRRGRKGKPATAAPARGEHLTEAERKDKLAREVWAILEPNRPIERFLGKDPAPADAEPGVERKP